MQSGGDSDWLEALVLLCDAERLRIFALRVCVYITSCRIVASWFRLSNCWCCCPGYFLGCHDDLAKHDRSLWRDHLVRLLLQMQLHPIWVHIHVCAPRAVREALLLFCQRFLVAIFVILFMLLVQVMFLVHRTCGTYSWDRGMIDMLYIELCRTLRFVICALGS